MSSAPTPCPICRGSRDESFQATLLGHHLVSYYSCDECGLLQTEKPFWLEEAYSEAIAETDTGVLRRTLEVAQSLRVLYSWFLRSRGPYLDVAGGYGLLARHLRDHGFDCHWSDPYASNLVARGFERRPAGRPEGRTSGRTSGRTGDTYRSDRTISVTSSPDTPDIGAEPCTAVSAIEVLEHVEDPLSFIRDALDQGACSTIVFTTVLFDGEPPAPDWWYYSVTTGQHISFYQRRTLQRIGDSLGLRLYSRGSLHMLTDRSRPDWLFGLATSRYRPLLATLASRRFESLTEPDHTRLGSSH